ncbi:MAG: Gldg family protein, partial [Deltaproteobacteria bacterium]|nr:Gldg family protein [Deltaproteobacteria bacterium]
MFKYQRSTSYTANAVVLSLIVIGILAALNFMGSRHTKRFDFTEQKLFSLAPQSIKVVKSLKDEVKITGFFKAQEKPLFDDLVNKYTYHSNKIKVNFIDPDKDVAVAKQYKVKKYQT